MERRRQVFQKLPLREAGYTGENGKVDFWLIPSRSDWLGLWYYLSRKVIKKTLAAQMGGKKLGVV
ncbi:TPA: hypothetical protein DIV45_02270 [Patescibacteria group bacterium]|nr:hypothetical protein [Patescibacteria group bacterium]